MEDKRLPEQFTCFDCRLRQSREWDIITGKIHADIMCRFKELALFRGVLRLWLVPVGLFSCGSQTRHQNFRVPEA